MRTPTYRPPHLVSRAIGIGVGQVDVEAILALHLTLVVGNGIRDALRSPMLHEPASNHARASCSVDNIEG